MTAMKSIARLMPHSNSAGNVEFRVGATFGDGQFRHGVTVPKRMIMPASPGNKNECSSVYIFRTNKLSDSVCTGSAGYID